MFESFPLWLNLLILAIAAAGVWLSGTRLEAAVSVISRRTQLGSAFGGLILLAAATSLPEVATTITGGIIGNAELLTNNLLGGVAMQTAVLVIADLTFSRGPLTYFSPRFSLLLNGVSLVLLLGVTLMVLIAGDRFSIMNVGIGSFAIFFTYLTLFYLGYRLRNHPGWEARNIGETDISEIAEESIVDSPLRREWIAFAIGSGLIAVAGAAVMLAAEALTKQTGMGASFVGATLVAIATSLPEVSTTVAAVRRGNNEMAISNIFGSNMWDVGLLFIGDIFFRSGPLLAAAPRAAMFTGTLGLVMTCVYLWGLLERQDKSFARLGIDSWVNIALYLAGLGILYVIQ